MQYTSNEMFGPESEFSRNMLASIPRKVMTWLSTLGRFSMDGRYQALSWHYSNNDFESFLLIDGETPVEIRWNGENENPQMVRGSEEWFLNIEHNLDRFVALEKRIYDELELLQKEVLGKSDDPLNNLEEYFKAGFFKALVEQRKNRE